MKLNKTNITIFSVLLVVFFVYIQLVKLSALPYFGTIISLNNVLNGEWVEYKDETLGISFKQPSSWPKPKSYYKLGNLYSLTVGGLLPFYNTFSKLGYLREFPEDQYTKEQVNINRIDFTFYRKKLANPNRFVGIFISQKPYLELEVNTLTYDFSGWEKEKHDQIMKKLIYSIKPL